MASPIPIAEFASALRRCLPLLPAPVIAVANSAGPDSTCLLFLLRQLFPPRALLSVHVLHRLQPAGPSMALAAAENARLLGVPHQALDVPWGVPPFPPLPTSGPVERLARDARYNLLFHAASRARAPLLALAHHADDQLETAFMRLLRGSSLLGAAGMRPLRRCGMGTHSDLAAFGYHGLDTFILRPLLPFPKDRILATCRVNRLNYVLDPTNTQPHHTPRNAIRFYLGQDPPFSQPFSSPLLPRLRDTSSFLQSFATNVVGEKQRLYSAVKSLAARSEHIDHQGTLYLLPHRPANASTVTSFLDEYLLPSPMGTILLPSVKLLDILDPDVRSALVLRVMRYASFHPWGSLRADAGRRRTSIHRIIQALWASDPQASRIKKFTAGGGVLWTPAIFHPSKPLKVGDQCLHLTLGPDDRFCWLASRIPPFSKNPQRGAGSPDKLLVDLTERLRATVSFGVAADPFQILYDCRFLLRIDPSQMPTHVKSALEEHDQTTIQVLPFTQYYWPKVVLQRESHPDEILAVPQENDSATEQFWISIKWIRLLDAA